MDGRKLCFLLRLLVLAVVQHAQGELAQDEEEDEEADNLMRAVEVSGLKERAKGAC